MTRGRPLRGLFGGLFLGLFLDVDLVFGGVVTLDNALLTILPIALLLIGLALGIWAPIGRPPASALPPPAPVPGHAPRVGPLPRPPSAARPADPDAPRPGSSPI